MSISDDETLTWHDSTTNFDYTISPPPVQQAEGEEQGESNLTKYAIGATVGAAAVLVLPTVVLVGAGVAAGAAFAKSDKVAKFYEKHTGRSSTQDSQSMTKLMAATVSGARTAGKSIADKFRKLSGVSPRQSGRPYGEPHRG